MFLIAIFIPAGGPYVTTCHSDTECGTVCGDNGPDTVAFNEGAFGTSCQCQDGSDDRKRLVCHVWDGLDAYVCQDNKPPICTTACDQTVCIGKDGKYTNAVIRSACPQFHPQNVQQCCNHKTPDYCTCLFRWTSDLNWQPYSNLGNSNGQASGAWWGACGSELMKLNISINSERATRLVQPFLRDGKLCHEETNNGTTALERVALMDACAAHNREGCISPGCVWCTSSASVNVSTKCYEAREAEVLQHVVSQEAGEDHFVCAQKQASTLLKSAPPSVIASYKEGSRVHKSTLMSGKKPGDPSTIPKEISTDPPNTWDDCVNYLNYLRQSVGKDTFLTPATWDAFRCAYTDATQDGPNFPASAHKSFGKCGEAAQCEAAGMLGQQEDGCKQGLDMYFKEGPGGGHYDIMMGDYSYMAWGICEGCSNVYKSMVTHNFYR
jgi:hypothetical protein